MKVRRSLRAFSAVALTAPTLALGASLLHAQGPLVDLQPAVPAPTDGARATVIALATESGRTIVFLRVRGLDPADAGRKLGAHVHVGPCVAGDGAAAGPHYKHDPAAPVSPEVEVWLDFTVSGNGTGFALTRVPFVIEEGDAQSVVVHALPTDPSGAAGDRLACLPVAF